MPALEAAGTERYPRTLPSQVGIPKAAESTVVVGCFNDLDAVETVIRRNANELACVLAEPILADAGIIPPVPGFLEGLRQICDENEVLLIFDEVITGFRVSLGGAQELYGGNAGHHLRGQGARRRHAGGGGVRRQEGDHGA